MNDMEQAYEWATMLFWASQLKNSGYSNLAISVSKDIKDKVTRAVHMMANVGVVHLIDGVIKSSEIGNSMVFSNVRLTTIEIFRNFGSINTFEKLVNLVCSREELLKYDFRRGEKKCLFPILSLIIRSETAGFADEAVAFSFGFDERFTL